MFLANKLNKGAGTPATTDPQFNYVTMLLHGDGTNGAQNNTFLDSSTNNFTITRNGNTTQGSFSPYGSNWSNFFNGSTDYLTVPDNAAFNLGSSNFTAECWVYFNSSADQYFFGQIQNSVANRSFVIAIIASKLYFEVRSGNTAYSITAASNVVLNQWLHIAAVRNGSTITLYQNGVSIGTVSVSGVTVNDSTNLMGVGCGGGYVAEPMNGYISNARLVVGTAVYTAAFTPPTVPLTAITNTVLLTCQSNRFVDNSSSPKTITVNGTPSVQRFNPFGASTAYSTSVIGGSGYFDGSGDSLTAPDDTAFDLGSGDFTIEGWVYQTATNTTGAGFVAQWTNSAALSWYLGTTTTNQFVFAWTTNGSTIQTIINSSPVTLNTWTHYAASRSGTTGRIFINGVQAATGTISGTIFNSSNVVTIGNNPNPSGSAWHLSGYMTDARVVKGTAVYTANFTPPTAPLTAVSGTSLLLKYINGAIFDNAMMNDLETVGNAQISTSVKKYGTGSLAFDGTGDFLRPPVSPMGNLGGNFTIEFWAYLNDQNAQDFVGTATWANYIGAGKSGWSVSYTSSKVSFSYQNNNSYVIATTFAGTALSNSTWNHIAIVRVGGTITCYVNGVASATTISSSTNFVSTTYGVWVGAAGDADTYGYELNGYLDDVRITNGYARYTANFTPPTAAFFDTGPV